MSLAAIHGINVQIEGVLVETSVNGQEMDRALTRLASSEVVSQAFWSASTTE